MEAELEALRLRDDAPATIEDELDGQRVVWHDVLPLLDEAATELTLGDLLHGEAFNLHEAMSALEMGDPQMDSMAAAAPDEPPPEPPPEAIAPADLIGILDEVVCSEHAWYRGFPLAHALFRLDWLHVADELRPLELRAPLIAAVKCAAAVRALVLRGDVAEEEDFVPSCGGLSMQEAVSEVAVAKLLNEAEEEVQQRLRDAKRQAEEDGGGGGGGGEGGGSSSADGGGGGDAARRAAELEAVLCRLRFRRGVVVALCALLKPSAKGAEVARKMLTFAQAQLGPMRATVALGAPREALGCLAGRTSRKLLGAAPQRRLDLLSRADALGASEALFGRLRAVCAASDVADHDAMVGWLAGAVGGGAAGCVVTRSCAHLLGVSEERGGPFLRPRLAPMLWEAVRVFAGLPPDVWRALGEQEEAAELQHQLAQAALVRMRLGCLNGARHRRRLRHFLHDWAPLQPMCDAFDEVMQSRGLLERGVQPLGAWVFGATLDAMGLYLRLGFELELFSPCEFQMVYWYMDCICGMRLQLQEAVQRSALVQAQAAAAAEGAKKGNKKKAKPAKPAVAGGAATRAELQLIPVRRDLCRAAALLIAALRQQALLPFAPSTFMPLARRFERRFHVFRSLHRPTPLPMAHFEQLCSTQLDVTPPAELTKSAAAFLKAAKTALETAIHQPAAPLADAQLAELKALVRVSVANTVFIASLPPEPPPGKVAAMSFGAHRHFPVFSLVDARP